MNHCILCGNNLPPTKNTCKEAGYTTNNEDCTTTPPTYILKKDCPNIYKETGDCYNGEYGTSPEDIQHLIDKGTIERDVPCEPYTPIDWSDWPPLN